MSNRPGDYEWSWLGIYGFGWKEVVVFLAILAVFVCTFDKQEQEDQLPQTQEQASE